MSNFRVTGDEPVALPKAGRKLLNWKQTGFFTFLVKCVKAVVKPMKTLWSSAFEDGPSVFVCNHNGALGPIGMCACFEKAADTRAWINAQVLSVRETPAYVRQDFWWPQGSWYTKILDYTVPYPVALILPLILRGAASIPVYHDTRVMSTLKGSVECLNSGHHIMLFPEHPTGFGQYQEDVVSGFVSLGRLYYRRTGKCIKFYPTYMDWTGKEIRVGQPIAYDPQINYDEQAKAISEVVSAHFKNLGETGD